MLTMEEEKMSELTEKVQRDKQETTHATIAALRAELEERDLLIQNIRKHLGDDNFFAIVDWVKQK